MKNVYVLSPSAKSSTRYIFTHKIPSARVLFSAGDLHGAKNGQLHIVGDPKLISGSKFFKELASRNGLTTIVLPDYPEFVDGGQCPECGSVTHCRPVEDCRCGTRCPCPECMNSVFTTCIECGWDSEPWIEQYDNYEERNN